MLFAVEVSTAAVWAGVLAPILTTLVGGVALWLKASAALKLAQAADLQAKASQVKSDASHEIVKDIKELAVKTEQQTNSRLSELDKKVHEHELRCIQSKKDAAEQQRQIAELKLALAEERAKRH